VTEKMHRLRSGGCKS